MLSIAHKRVDQAEIYFYNSQTNHAKYENGRLDEIKSSIQSGYSLRIIKDHTLGFGYTKNIRDPEAFVELTLNSLKTNTRANFSFPEPFIPQRLNTYNPEIEKVNMPQVIEECNRILEIVKTRIDGKVDILAAYGVSEIHIANTNGLNLNDRFSFYLGICHRGTSR